VAAAVLMQVPQVIVGFVALYCMGLVSEIHRRAKRTRLNLFALFHSAAAKFMLAEVAFRGLIGGVWHGSATTLKHLTRTTLLRRLKDVFNEHILDGTLQEDELERMSAVIFSGMDTNKDGMVSCNEFIHTLTDDGEIDMRKMALMFDDNGELRKQATPTAMSAAAVMGRFLDTTQQQRNTVSASVASWEKYNPRSMTHSSSVLWDPPVNDAACHDSHIDDAVERLEALEEEGRRMEERIAALEGASQAAAAVSAPDVGGVDEASPSQVLPSGDGVAEHCLDVDVLREKTCHSCMSTLAQMMETLRGELHKELRHLEERFEGLEKTVQVKTLADALHRDPQCLQTSSSIETNHTYQLHSIETNHTEGLQASPVVLHRAGTRDLPTVSLGQTDILPPHSTPTCTEESRQGAALAALPSSRLRSLPSSRPQQPKIAAPVKPVLLLPRRAV